MFKVSYIGTKGKLTTPPVGHAFSEIKFLLAILIGHPVTISVKIA